MRGRGLMNVKSFFDSPICEFGGSVLGPELQDSVKLLVGPAFSWLRGLLLQDSLGFHYRFGSVEGSLFIQQTHGVSVSTSLALS